MSEHLQSRVVFPIHMPLPDDEDELPSRFTLHDKLSELELELDIARAVAGVLEDIKGSLYSGYEARHKEQGHADSFAVCQEEWCAHVRGYSASGRELFSGFEMRHEKDHHMGDFDECKDRWCKYVWDLMNLHL